MTNSQPLPLAPEFANTLAILARDNRDPIATIEVTTLANGVMSGGPTVIALLREHQVRALQVWTLAEGAALNRGEVALRVRGHLRDYGALENALTGILGLQSAWATAARALCEAASPTPVLLGTTRLVQPLLTAQFAAAATAGGCLTDASVWRQGLLARAPVVLLGDTVRAANRLVQVLAPGVPALVRVDTFHDQTDEAVRVALALGDKLGGVLIECVPPPQSAGELLQHTRAQLDLAGFPRVKLFAGGDLTLEFLQHLKQVSAPVEGYFVGDAIANVHPLPFAAELKESDNKPIGRRGLTPGTTPSPRLSKIDLDKLA